MTECVDAATITAAGTALAAIIAAVASWVRARAAREKAVGERRLAEARAARIVEKLGLRKRLLERALAGLAGRSTLVGRVGAGGSHSSRLASMLDESDEQLVERWLAGEVS